MDPAPSVEEIAASYPEDYAPHQTAPQERDWSLLGDVPEQGVMIEIGCGAGNALASFARFRPAWNITGVDFSVQGLAVARAALPQGTFIQADIPEWIRQAPSGQAQLVICEHVIEHVFDPTDLFHHLVRLLAPGGQLLLSIPNAGSWTMRLFRSYAHHLEAPRHIRIPSHRSIQSLCAREGVRIARYEAQAYPSVFFRSLGFVWPTAARACRLLRIPSLLRLLSLPFVRTWATPFSKVTYVITR
jgi:SAM-dependent methyltransferase